MKRSLADYSFARVLSAVFAVIALLGLSNTGWSQKRLHAMSGGSHFSLASQAQPATGAVEKTATVYGAKIHYQEAGSGPAVVLLHGLGGDSSNWAPTIGPLSKKFRVIAPDQIGFGRSDKPFINYRVSTLVDFLAGFLKELKVERATLVGNSLGGWTALAFALAHPQKVDRIVLVDAAGYRFDSNTDATVLNVLNPSTRDGMKQVMSLAFYNKELYASDAVVDTLFSRKIVTGDGYTIQRFIESVVRGDDVLDNKLAAIKHPTLIVWGREDALTPLSMGERFKKEISGSELFIIEKCGHVPQMEKAAEFNAAVLKFLGSGESGK